MAGLTEPAIVVIGSGAGGGTIAEALTARGLHVVLLESGARIEPAEFRQDALGAYGQLTWLEPREVSGDNDATRLAPTAPAFTVRALGGSTVHWNGLAYRARPGELRARTTYGAIAGASLADWPLSEAELAPWYARAEARLGVSGTGGRAVHPPSNLYSVLWNGARRIGYRRISNARQAINVGDFDGRPGCRQMGFCNQGCVISAKWSTLVSDIPRAEATGRLDLRTGATAVRLELGRDGRVARVLYVDDKGALHAQAARLVVVAANAIETARLLLLSEQNGHPRGLANGSDQLGRNYMRHVGAWAAAEMPRPVNMHRGITVPGTVFDEARHAPERGFAGGYLIEAASLSPVEIGLMMREPAFGPAGARVLERYDHLAGVLMVGEELPRPDNRITLSARMRDLRGLPVAHVHVDEHPQGKAMRRHFQRRAEALLAAVRGVNPIHVPLPSAAHNMGTARMSARPEDGVTDPLGRAWEVDNLWIGDGSLFPTSLSVNPTLTIIALALRQADAIARSLGR